jgi:hypothetical protein
MGRLHKLALLIGLAVCSQAAASPVAAQDFCSLKVRVLTPNGQRLEVPIAVREKNGRNIEKKQGLAEDVKFCDLGISPVTITVGLKGCYEIVVNEVPLFWKEPYTLKVIYDYKPCQRDLLPPPEPLCEVLFRIRDSNGRWVNSAKIDIDEPHKSRLQTDNAGRGHLFVKVAQTLRGTVSATGYATKNFSFECSDSGVHEEMLTLSSK